MNSAIYNYVYYNGGIKSGQYLSNGKEMSITFTKMNNLPPLEIMPRCSLRGRSPSSAEPRPSAAAGLDFRIIQGSAPEGRV